MRRCECVMLSCFSVSDSATVMDCSPPGSSVPGILQAKMLEWVAISSSRGSSQPRDQTVSLISPALTGRFFTTGATWEQAVVQPKVSQNGLVVMELWNSRASYPDSDHFSLSFFCYQARPLLLHLFSKYYWMPITHQALFWVLGMFEWESEVAQLCPTLCDPMDCSLSGSSVHRIFQAIVLEWVAISFYRGSSWPRDWTQISLVVDRRFTVWAIREVLRYVYQVYFDLSINALNSPGLFLKCRFLGPHEL